MKERPILFSGDMVRAILDGRKSQTRRVVKPPRHVLWSHDDPPPPVSVCAFGKPGDLLWVRETWGLIKSDGFESYVGPLADCPREGYSVEYRASVDDIIPPGCWRPSIHMPRWASRITLRLTAVRVERVQDITWEDCEAEGCSMPMQRMGFDPAGIQSEIAFRPLWDSLDAERGYGWDANPWVWVLGFERVKEDKPCA